MKSKIILIVSIVLLTVTLIGCEITSQSKTVRETDTSKEKPASTSLVNSNSTADSGDISSTNPDNKTSDKTTKSKKSKKKKSKKSSSKKNNKKKVTVQDPLTE